MQNKKISLVIPAYNEEAIIEDTINTVISFLWASFDSYELIIADDGSTDRTRAIVEGINDPDLRLVTYSPNRGKGCAVREGILAATGDYIVYTDADLAYGVECIAQIIKLLEDTGAELAAGSRKLHPDGYADYPPIRLLASRCFSFLTGAFAGFHFDTQCGLKAYSAHAAREVFSRCETDGFAFDFEAIMLAESMGFTITQLPVKIINHRESKVRVLRDSLKMFNDIIRIRRSVKTRMKKEGGA